MLCPSCGFDNPEGMKFCGECGVPIGVETHPRPAPRPKIIPTPMSESLASGRYKVQKLLGEGGKKKVFLAHDTVLDRDVALAIIKIEGLDEASRARVTREASAMIAPRQLDMGNSG